MDRSDLHRPNDAWTSQTHSSPGILQDRPEYSIAASLSERVSRASRSTGLAGRVRYYASLLKIRATTRVFHGPGDRQVYSTKGAKVLILRRVRRQPRGDKPPLRALSPHKPPAISIPAQTAPLLSRGEVPEARVGTSDALDARSSANEQPRPWEK